MEVLGPFLEDWATDEMKKDAKAFLSEYADKLGMMVAIDVEE